jgi:hypothetical protein
VNDSAVIKWDATRKKETVNLNDLIKYSIDNSQSRKRKSPDFFVPLPDTKIASTELSNDDDIVTGSQVEIYFTLWKICRNCVRKVQLEI